MWDVHLLDDIIALVRTLEAGKRYFERISLSKSIADERSDSRVTGGP